MGMIDRIIGAGPTVTAVGNAASSVAEIFTPNATKRMELDAQTQSAAMAQFSMEFGASGTTWFDRAVNGMNRLPRPALALGTMGLFIYSMVDPTNFSIRMESLGLVPEPLWWLLGAIVSFYFGSREAHYVRVARVAKAAVQAVGGTVAAPEAAAVAPLTRTGDSYSDNPALRDWAASRA